MNNIIICKQTNSEGYIVNNEFTVATLSSDGKLTSAQLPDTMQVRLSVLHETDAVLSQVVLDAGEIAAPSDKNYLRRGDGTTLGGTIVGGGNSYIEPSVPSSPPLLSYSNASNSGIPAFSHITIIPSQKLYTFINQSGQVFDYPGLWCNSLSFTENNSSITGSFTVNHVVGAASVAWGGLTSCTAIIFPALKIVTSIIGAGAGLPNNINTLSMPELEVTGGNVTFGGNNLSTLNINKLITVGGSLAITHATGIQSIDLSSIKNISGGFSLGSSFVSSSNLNSMKQINFSSLEYVGSISMGYATNFSGLYMPSIKVINGSISCSAPFSTGIIDFNMGSGLLNLNGNITMTGQRLSTNSIENIFVRLSGLNGLNDTIAYSGGRSINLSGGTSAGISSLTSLASAARTALLGRGVTITLNS
jgi:hypothetical protein